MLLIKDKTDDAQGFPLVKLLEMISDCLEFDSDYPLRIVKAFGYGIQICEFEDELEEKDGIPITMGELLKLALDNEQWFYDFDCFDPKSGFRFGLIDSGALFIKGEKKIVENISQSFQSIEEFWDL